MSELPPTLGWYALDFIEQFCVNGPGDVQGTPVVVTDETARIILNLYEIDPITGRRRYKRGTLVRPKGWSKSSLAAYIALFEAFGPARFDSWGEDGTPIGRRVRTPIIRIVATEESQTGNIYDNIYYNLTQGPLSRSGSDVGLTRIMLPGGGNIRPVSAGAASKDGGRETFICFDELHLFTLPELHRLHQTYLRNLRKRTSSDPWSLETTTAYRPGENSVAETAMKYAEKILAGEALDSGFYYDHTQPDHVLDLNDPAQRLIALRQAYGDCNWVDFDQIVNDYDDPTTDQIDWARYYGNFVVAHADSFIDYSDWKACGDSTLSLHDHDPITLGIDSSLVDDATVVSACRVSDNFVSILGIWQKPEGRAGVNWTVPFHEVDSCVRLAFDNYKVLRCYVDPQYLHSYMESWSLSYGNRIRSWTTHRTIPMSFALERFYTAVRTHEGIRHDGGTTLTTHVLNARTFRSQGRTLVKKESPHSPKKIDALISSVLAFEAASDARTAKEDVTPERPQRRAWSF